MEFTQEIKPKIKNNRPIMRIEIYVSRLVMELTSAITELVLFII